MRGRVTELTVGMGREVLDEDVGASVVVELTVLEVEVEDDDLEEIRRKWEWGQGRCQSRRSDDCRSGDRRREYAK